MSKLLLATALCLPLLLSVSVRAGVNEGDVAPEVILPSLSSDEQVSLSSLRGKVVYVDFWASWCGPCRVSFPILEELRQEFADQGFEIYAISVDEVESEALEFLDEVPVSYPVVLDDTGATPTAWGPPGMPTAYLVGRDGVVRAVKAGFKKSDGDKIRAAIVQLLSE